MHFAFDEDHRSFAESTRDLFADRVTPDTIREAWRAEPGQLDPTPWQAMVEIGLLAAHVPETRGGLGLDELATVLVFEEAGYAGVPHPIVETTLIAGPLLPHADGRMVTTDIGSNGAPWAAEADQFLVLEGSSVALVNAEDVTVEPIPSIDGARRLGVPSWSAESTTVLTRDPRELEELTLRGALGTAALQLGLSRRVLDLAVDHVCEREQFGVAIGSFQAVKHALADVAKLIHFARPAVHRAAYSLATRNRERGIHVAMAKSLSGEAAELAARVSLQCHGAIGYTVEHDLQLYLKRIWALTPSWGDPRSHRTLIADHLRVGEFATTEQG